MSPEDIAQHFGGSVRCLSMPLARDERGSLVTFDHDTLPFTPRRSFVIHDVPECTVRGGHAHRECEQLFICLSGQVEVDLAFENKTARVMLDGPALGLYLAPRVWSRQQYLSPGSSLLVFASKPYDPGSYLRPSDQA